MGLSEYQQFRTRLRKIRQVAGRRRALG